MIESQVQPPRGLAAWRRPVVSGWRPLHAHRDVEFNLVERGSVEYLHAGRPQRLLAGRLCCFWAMIPHHVISASADAYMSWITLPLDWLTRCGIEMEQLAQLLNGEILAECASDEADPATIDQWSSTLQRHDERWRRVVELEVEARLRRMLLNGLESVRLEHHPPEGPRSGRRSGARREAPPPGARARGGARPSSLEMVVEMAQFMTDRYAEPIRVADVADEVNIDPSYAMRLFRQHLGLTIVDYLTRQRVAAAQRRLLTTDDPVLTIAHDSGFGSASRFHQAFRRFTGTTPARFRRRLRSLKDAD